MDKPQLIVYEEKSVNYSIFDVEWIPCSAKFGVLGSRPNGTGVLQIFELEDTKLSLMKEVERPSAFKCGSMGASSLRASHMTIGDFKGGLEIIDLEYSSHPVYKVKAHDSIINSLDATGGVFLNCGAAEIVTGSRDGAVKVWDPRQDGSPVANITALSEADGGSGSRDCWAVTFGNSFNNEERIVAAGYDNGDLKLFDLRTMSVRWDTNVRNGICSLQFDRKDIAMNKLAVATLEGGLFLYDLHTQHPEKGFACVGEKNAGRALGTHGVISGAKATVWCVRHLPQNRDICASGGGSGSIRLWQYSYPSKRAKAAGDGHDQGVAGTIEMLNATTVSSQPINCFEWNPDHPGLAVCGAFDQTIRLLVTTKLNTC